MSSTLFDLIRGSLEIIIKGMDKPMKYTAKFFRDGMPEWKRKKDPILSRIFYRRVSFGTAAIAANLGISANTVSYFSAIVAVCACMCFLHISHVLHIIGAFLINIWLILDCTDGNLARSVKSQPFGEFADGISSYILVGLMCTMMGVAVYFEGGAIVSAGSPWIILVGALASSSDSLMRLIYQKYKNTERDMADKEIVKIEDDVRTDHSQIGSFRVRVEAELGIGGLLPIAILLAAIFQVLDIIVIYCFLYYGASCFLASVIYIRKAIKHTKVYEMRE
ncbi:CDP-alcohol phosphatidyltransferase family protein [Enterococcus faecium]|uniref:CDP-alcohol phosphatidyltransferase family protein n=1 Tax=Enterococcus faecium TaxID=1352 RepID=UPI001E44673D|nr:CDP-alcohol phosphatidyltransferase family protein [Enterococcus faecium]MCD5099982.1 CDP-alcohol phosphatidyltransferase family protein [Enterococcus faecium]